MGPGRHRPGIRSVRLLPIDEAAAPVALGPGRRLRVAPAAEKAGAAVVFREGGRPVAS